MSVVIWVVLALVSGLVGAEIVGWCAPLQRALIRRAAAVLPSQERARYVEEWYAELEALPQAPITRLLWVLSLVLKRGALARALGVPRSTVGLAGAAKRGADLVGSVVALVVLAPLLAAVALAVKMDGEGPVFYRQVRVRADGSTFTMLKFRSMRVDNDGPYEGASRRDLDLDPRVTHVGQFLRKVSLDELPQLFNVLAGDMSLVGPRALTSDQIDEEDRVPGVAPGITGLASVNGFPDLDPQARRQLKDNYAAHWSPLLDLLILWRTVKEAVRRAGER